MLQSLCLLLPSSAKVNPSFYSWHCSSVHSHCAFQIPMATWRRHTLKCKPVLFYMLTFTWERTYIWSHLWLQLWIAEGHIRKTCWITGWLWGPPRGEITFSACQAGGLGTDRAQMQTLMLQLTHYLLLHTFSSKKTEEGGATTGGNLVLKSFRSLKLTFWRLKLGSVWIRSRQGARHTLQCRHFLHRARNEWLTRVFWRLCKRLKVHTANTKRIALVTQRVALHAFSKWTGVRQAL